MKWLEQHLQKNAQKWGVNEAMAAHPTRKELNALRDKNLVESILKTWFEIGGEKRTEREVD